MVLIFGGAYNGKLDFAINFLNLNKSELVNGEDCSIEDFSYTRGIYNLHLLIKKLIDENIENISDLLLDLIKKSNIEVIISDELGMGIIPIDKKNRILREENGRLLSELAAISTCVYRVLYGIPQKLK